MVDGLGLEMRPWRCSTADGTMEPGAGLGIKKHSTLRARDIWLDYSSHHSYQNQLVPAIMRFFTVLAVLAGVAMALPGPSPDVVELVSLTAHVRIQEAMTSS